MPDHDLAPETVGGQESSAVDATTVDTDVGTCAEASSIMLTIDLRGRIAGGASLKLLRLEMERRFGNPFALIRYSEDGVEQHYGLRMDLDKQVFLDHFDDPAKDAVLDRAVPQIIDLVADALYP